MPVPQMIAEGFLETVAASWCKNPKATGETTKPSQHSGFANFLCPVENYSWASGRTRAHSREESTLKIF